MGVAFSLIILIILIIGDLINGGIIYLFLSPLVGYAFYLFSLLLYGRFDVPLIIGIFAYKTYLCEMRYFKRRLRVLSVCIIEEIIFRYVPINYLDVSDSIKLFALSVLVSAVFSSMHNIKRKRSTIKQIDLFIFAMALFYIYFYTSQITFVILIHYFRNVFVICGNDKITYNELVLNKS